MNRCIGGCTITRGEINDARTGTSTIPDQAGTFTVGEFQENGQTGAGADTAWNELVQCVKEVYSPFQVQIVDQKPNAGSYHMAIVAGLSADIGLPPSIQGIAPSSLSCTAQDNVISFSFANSHPGSGRERMLNLCWTVAQEAAHAFGIPNHSWAFTDGRSACNDPMTYREDCGGQKFFRNQQATCGDFAEEPSCACGPTHNTHLKLQSVFGPQEPSTGKPTATVTLPVANGALGAVVGVQAGSKRGVAKVELLVNGFKWAEVPGAQFGNNGQPNPSSYTLQVPSNLPGGVVDIVARAYDDLGAYGDSPVVTAMKGAPCTSADSCAEGQKCESGKCFWDPPTGEIGDSCAFPQACLSMQCSPTVNDRICTQGCVPGVADSCPDNFECLATSAGNFCYFPADEGGCCTVSRSPNAIFVQGGLSALVFGFLVFRRRRK
ncbi:MAG: hypothetical protein SFX73_30775 [Kofleriaceae bacterium]|nr:hypothetical protein [Kofleriaceae bacterium]